MLKVMFNYEKAEEDKLVLHEHKQIWKMEQESSQDRDEHGGES